MDMNFRNFLMLEGDYSDYTFGLEIEVALTMGQSRQEPRNAEEIKNILQSMKLGWSFGIDQTCVPGIEIKTKPNPISQESLNTLKSDLAWFNQGIARQGLVIVKNPSRCATHIHIGGLSDETKTKVAKVWVDGVQDMGSALISPERKPLLDSPSYMRRVKSIDQYQTLPHSIPKTNVGKIIQRTLTYLKNTLSLDRYAGYDKFYSMSPRGGMGTLEFRTKESTTDGNELAILVKSIAALCSQVDHLYDKDFDSSDVRKAMYRGGVGPKDLSYVMRKARS